METKLQAQSFPMEEEAVACVQRVAIEKQCKEMEPEGAAVPEAEEVVLACDQRVANAKQCKEMVPEIAVSMEEEGMVACVQRVAIVKQCKEIMEPEGEAAPEAGGVVACAQGMAIAELLCKVMEPDHVAVPMEEEARACDQGVAKVKLCKEMEPKFAVPKEEEEADVVCTQSVVIAEPCKEMKPEVAVVPMEEEAEACDQANTKECKETAQPQGAVPMEEEIVACDQQVVPPVVPLLAPGIVKLRKELDPEAVIPKNDLYLTIGDCSGELPLPLTAANGDGDGNGGKNIVNVIINGSKVTDSCLTSEPISEPPVENPVEPEPSWGDVPDEPVTVPVTVEKTPRFPKRQRPAPENVEVDDVVQTMRNILMDLRNVDDARLHPDDDAKVRSLLEFHPKAQEKMGSGIDYIKIKRHSIFKDVRCFWVVRTDGTETDFSYHKCLKEKVAKNHPSFVDRYDAVYRAPKRPRQA